MSLFFKCDKDPEGTSLRVDSGFRGKGGKDYLLLTRLPPHYPKPPTFVVELSSDTIELRSGPRTTHYHKAYAHQDFSPKELKYLREADSGRVSLPLFGGGGYPTITRALGNPFHKYTASETAKLVNASTWKLVGGQR